MAKLLSGTRVYGTATIDNQLFVSGTTAASSTITGALQVIGGAGIGQNLYVGGNLNVTGTISGSIAASINTATNLAGGTTGQIPYQTGAGATGFVGPGTAGQLLVSAGTAAPVYTNTSSIVVGYSNQWSAARTITLGGDLTGSVNIDGSSNVTLNATIASDSVALGTDTTGNYVASGTTTGFGVSGSASSEGATFNVSVNSTSANTVNTIVFRDHNGNFSAGNITASALIGTVANTVSTATNLSGGTAGQLPYQTGPNATGFFGPGTAGNILVSNGAAVPSYNNTLTLASTTNASSTQTGAFQVVGGAGIGQNLYVGGTLQIGPATGGTISGIAVLTSTNIFVTGSTNATSTITGALQVTGGVGIGQAIWAGGAIRGGKVTAVGDGTPISFESSAGIGIGDGVTPGILCVRGGNATTEGGQLVLGFGNNSATNFTGQANNSWNIDVAGGTYDLFRIFRVNNAGTAKVAVQIDNTNAGTQIDSLGVGTAASGTAGEIRATNEITAYYTSDRTLKENLQIISNPISMITRLNGYFFNWKDDYIKNRGGEDGYFVRKKDIGVIAQEVEDVLPEIVASRDDGTKAVKYEKIIPLLIESIKEQQNTINQIIHLLNTHNIK